ncbi:RNA polymerase sigma factor [Nonomuraea angiospora]
MDNPAEGEHADRVAAQVTAAGARCRVATELSRLPDGERDVLLLVAYGDLSYEEIAHTLDIPSGTVASRLSREDLMNELHDDQGSGQLVEPHHVDAVVRLLRSYEPPLDAVVAGRARLLAEAAATTAVDPPVRTRKRRRGRLVGAALRLAATVVVVAPAKLPHSTISVVATPARAGAQLSGGNRAGSVHPGPARGRSWHRPASRPSEDEHHQSRERAAGGAPCLHLVPGDRLDRRTPPNCPPTGGPPFPVTALAS